VAERANHGAPACNNYEERHHELRFPKRGILRRLTLLSLSGCLRTFVRP
jgi:hypothetical protein